MKSQIALAVLVLLELKCVTESLCNFQVVLALHPSLSRLPLLLGFMPRMEGKQ
jgi:hypothetical protein